MLIFIIKCHDTWWDLRKSDMWVYDTLLGIFSISDMIEK